MLPGTVARRTLGLTRCHWPAGEKLKNNIAELIGNVSWDSPQTCSDSLVVQDLNQFQEPCCSQTSRKGPESEPNVSMGATPGLSGHRGHQSKDVR
ncbi:MAG: hypothetical protein ACE5QF_08875 [Thermoplasmata archaeon]